MLICGGDGTIGWVFTTLQEEGLADVADVAFAPLGTGNDLSRVLGWGKATDGSRVRATSKPLSRLPLPHSNCARLCPRPAAAKQPDPACQLACQARRHDRV